MESYPSSPFADPSDPLYFSSDSTASPYSSSSSSSYPQNERAPSPFTSLFPPSFDTPLAVPNAAAHSPWNGMTWPAELNHVQQTNMRQQQQQQQQQHPAYHNGHAEQYHHQRQHHHHQQQHQQQQQQHPYYPTAVPYTATIAQPPYHSTVQHAPPPHATSYDYDQYVDDQSSLLPQAVPALILPTAAVDSTPTSSLPTVSYGFPDSVAPSTPPPPPIKFGDVFIGATADMALRDSQPVRPLNHAQMRVWQQFESGDTIRSISDAMGLKPHVVLNYIIYALESYSPSPSHPIFLHWPRFSIPPELMERVSVAMTKVGGSLGRLDMVKERLDGGGALDEDLRIAMIRWKMERALGAAYKGWDMYRVMSAEEAAERLVRQAKEDAGDDSTVGDGDEQKEGKKLVDEEKEPAVDMVLDSVHDESNESKQPPSAAPSIHKQSADDRGTEHDKAKDEEKEAKVKEMMVSVLSGSGATEPPYPPPLTASEMLYQLSVNGGYSKRCLRGRFKRDWSEIEAVLNKLVAEQLAWKRGLLYCPS